MEFPTNKSFEQNKETTQQKIKWREVPVDVIFHVISAYSVNVVTSYNTSGKAMYADLEDGEGNKYMTWLPSRLCIDPKNYGWKTRTAFVRPLGLKQSEKNPDRQYFDYDIMWAAC